MFSLNGAKVLSYLKLNSDGCLVNEEIGEQVHHHQGSLDGACGPYCVIMSLLVLGVIDNDIANNGYIYDGRTQVGRLHRALTHNNGALFQAGTNGNHLANSINSFEKDSAYCESGTGSTLFPKVIDSINNDAPVIIGIQGTDIAHWLLAIGYTDDLILLLDSANRLEISQYWNAVITRRSTQAGMYPYKYISRDGDLNVKFDEAVFFNTPSE